MASEATPYHQERGAGCTYLVHEDGRVLAYGPERNAVRQGLWLASAWTSDPRTDDTATYTTVAADATWSELQKAIGEWAGKAHS